MVLVPLVTGTLVIVLQVLKLALRTEKKKKKRKLTKRVSDVFPDVTLGCGLLARIFAS